MTLAESVGSIRHQMKKGLMRKEFSEIVSASRNCDSNRTTIIEEIEVKMTSLGGLFS